MNGNLAQLRVSVREYLNRSDISDERVNGFIDVGRREASKYKAREQENIILLLLDADLRAALPVRFMAARAVYTVAGVTLPQIGSVFASVGTEGGYRTRQDKLEVFGGGLKAGDNVELHYYEFPPELVNDADTNQYLLVNSDLWLWCAVKEGARYIRDAELMQAADGAAGEIGGRIGGTAEAGRQYGGPRSMTVRRN